METYFHGSSEFQAASAAVAGVGADGMQTLYLMNPNYVPYSDTNQPGPAVTNMFFLNPAGNALNPASLPHTPPPNHHYFPGLLPLPSPTVSNSDDQHRPPPLHGIVPGGHHPYNLWGSSSPSSIDHHQNSPAAGSSHPLVVSVAVAAAAAENSGGPNDVAASASSQLGLGRPVLLSPRQGLSLSLSSQQAVVPNYSNNRSSSNVEIQGQPTILGDDHMRISGNNNSTSSVVSNGISGVQSGVFLGSKYLRAAQELLDEVVNVGKVIKTDDVSEGSTKEKVKSTDKESVGTALPVTGGGGDHGSSPAVENGTKRGAELTTAQRQELQMKKAKLASMLDEVEQRYRQYHHQMQVVASSFEQAAGFGAAKSYTALALRTISKQFRCLKDAISGQIKATSKSLGEEDCIGAKIEGSRLRYVDHQLRQQRALQQLGMIQNNAWRPQRGLPERAVSVLRAWLFEHFLHPYPKDSDKHMLAKQTGLTRSQVSNWFINARVRLWKPMVEEMYLEEVKEQQERNGSEENNANKNEQKESGSSSTAQQDQSMSIKMDQVKTQSKPVEFSKSMNQIITSPTEFSNSTISTSPMGSASFLQPHAAFNLIGSSSSDHFDGVAQRSPKKPRTSTILNDLRNSRSSILSMDMEMKQGDQTREFNIDFGGGGGGFGSYSSMGEIGRFDVPEDLTPRFHGNSSSVSLTLGLPHCENQIGRRLELGQSEADLCGINTTHHQASHLGTATYDNIEKQNRKRFAAQLLPDFVA